MLTPADKALFGVYCQSYADYWRLTTELNAMGSWTQHNACSGSMTPVPQVAQRKAAWEMLRQAAAKFGFSPSDRAGIDLSQVAPPDPAKQGQDDWLLKRGRFAVVR
jgi:phage terminase small subunit